MSEWKETDFACPECGEILSHTLVKGKKGTVNVAFFCEGAGEDVFTFEIATGLSNADIAKLEKGIIIKKEMEVRLWEREKDKYSCS